MGTDPKELLKELVDDAKLVAAYGQRTGRLRDYVLLEAIAAVERLSELTWSAPEVVSLQASLNKALQSIAPTTLADLRSNWRPFDTTRSRRGQLAFVLATLVVMATTALATFEYNRGVALLKAVNTLQDPDPRSEMGAILRQLLEAKATAASGGEKSAIVLAEPHYVLVDKLHQIDSQVALYIPALASFREQHWLPHELLFGRRDALDQETRSNISKPGYGQGKCGTTPEPQVASASPQAASAQQTATLVAQADGAPSTTLPGSPAVAPTTADSQLAVVTALAMYLKEVEAIACVASLNYGPLTIPSIAGFVDDMVDWINIWGLWYLPALYGALGAILYYMRRILDPTIPDPTAVRVIHRTALGAFAGIIITWFWAPNSELSEGFTSIGITIFTLAFLIGFSIEVLFSLLDRLVGNMIDLAKGNDKTPPAPPLPTGT